MNYIKLTPENIDREHICCAISGEKDPQVRSKKDWLRERFAEGLVFLKADARGKCFIEYLPAEVAWAPIRANGYMFIDCFWVSGSLKGHGYANDLLDACIRDSKEKGKIGLCVLSSAKKRPFLSDPKYLAYKGFLCADTAEPYFELLYLPFYPDSPKPAFRECAKTPRDDARGFHLYYTCQCPYTAKYAPLLVAIAAEKNVPLTLTRIENRGQAQNAPVAITNYALFKDGEYITNEILSENKFRQLCDDY